MSMLNKDIFLKQCYSIKCPCPILSHLTTEVVVSDYIRFGLTDVLNAILTHAILQDEDTKVREKLVSVENDIHQCLLYAMGVLHFAFNDEYDERPSIVTELGNAFYALTKTDSSLDAFSHILIEHLERINVLHYIEHDMRRSSSILILSFARTLFHTHYDGISWQGYMRKWQLKKYCK